MQRTTSNSTFSGHLLILGAAVLWGTTGTSQALAPQGATPLSIGAVRLLVGSICLSLFAWAKGGFRSQEKWHIPTALFAGVAIAGYQLSFFAAVKLASVAIGTIVGIGSAPVFAALLGHFLENEELGLRWFIATALSITGVVLLGMAGSQSIHIGIEGLLLALGAGLTYAIYTLTNKRLIKTHQPDEVMALTFSLGALLLLPILFFSPMVWSFTPRGLLVTAHLGVLATGLSYALFGRGLRTVPVSTTTTLTLAEPLTAALLGILVLGENLTLYAALGIILIFLGLAILTICQNKDDSHCPE